MNNHNSNNQPEGFSNHVGLVTPFLPEEASAQYNNSLYVCPISRMVHPKKAIRVYSPIPMATNYAHLNNYSYQPPVYTPPHEFVPYTDQTINYQPQETITLSQELDYKIPDSLSDPLQDSLAEPFSEPLPEPKQVQKSDPQKSSNKSKTVTFSDTADQPKKDLNQIIVEFQKLRRNVKPLNTKSLQEETPYQNIPEIDELPEEIEPPKNLQSLVHENPVRKQDDREIDDLLNKILNEPISKLDKNYPAENYANNRQSDLQNKDIEVSSELLENFTKPKKKILPLVEIERERKMKPKLKQTIFQSYNAIHSNKQIKNSGKQFDKIFIPNKKQQFSTLDPFAEEKEEFLNDNFIEIEALNQHTLRGQQKLDPLNALHPKNRDLRRQQPRKTDQSIKSKVYNQSQEKKNSSEQEPCKPIIIDEKEEAQISKLESPQLGLTKADRFMAKAETELLPIREKQLQALQNDFQPSKQLHKKTEEDPKNEKTTYLSEPLHSSSQIYSQKENDIGVGKEEESKDDEEQLFSIIRNGVKLRKKMNKHQWCKQIDERDQRHPFLYSRNQLYKENYGLPYICHPDYLHWLGSKACNDYFSSLALYIELEEDYSSRKHNSDLILILS